MKILLNIFTSLSLLVVLDTCSNAGVDDPKKEKNLMEVTGHIQPQGMTSYQYGTHTLTNAETFYALRSEQVDLDQYIDQEVTILAEKITGYPLEGGPLYLSVLEVKP